VSSQSLRSLRKWRKSLMGSRIIVRCSDVKNADSKKPLGFCWSSGNRHQIVLLMAKHPLGDWSVLMRMRLRLALLI
jgi:hypothetical protein